MPQKKRIKGVIKTPELKTQPKVKLTLDLEGLVFTARGNTFRECLNKIYEDSIGKVKVWGTVTLEKENKKAELKYRPFLLKRAFVSKFAQDLMEDRLNMILK